jgi:hypothetical protein
MRIRELLETMEMPHSEAIGIFQKYGVNANGMNPVQLKTVRNSLMKNYHQDLTGNKGASQEINAAFDSLIKQPPTSSYYKRNDEPMGRPPWQTNLKTDYNKINRNDYTDLNFIKKTMWEKSGWTKEQWTAWGFDGYFFRGVFTVFGNPRIFKDIADAMVIWQTKGGNPSACRAVFVSGPDNNSSLFLIWADGKHFFPMWMPRYTTDPDPRNDQQFVGGLPEMLDRIRAAQEKSKKF